MPRVKKHAINEDNSNHHRLHKLRKLSDSDGNEDIIQSKLDAVLTVVKDLSDEVNTLVQQVHNLQDEVKSIKDALNKPYKQYPLLSGDESASTILNPSKGPFSERNLTGRTVPRPSSKELANSLGGKMHSLQFTSNLYVNLIEQVLGPSSDSRLNYKAMVKEAILITKAVISNIKEENNIDAELRWSQVDPTVKLAAYRQLEDATEHLLPLKICSEFWGAHILISNFWLKRKKSKSVHSKNEQEGMDDDSVSSRKEKSNAFSITFLTNQP